MSIHKDLLPYFEQGNLGKFQEALEVFQANPNYFVKERDKTVFEIILGTPNSSNFIKLCIENGADFFMVSEHNLDDSTFYSLFFLFFARTERRVEEQQRTLPASLRHTVSLSREPKTSRDSVQRYKLRRSRK